MAQAAYGIFICWCIMKKPVIFSCRELLETPLPRPKRIAIGAGLRFDILSRDRYKCQLCGLMAEDDVELEVDHKIPVAKGGTNDPDNLWTLCTTCNSGKSDKDL